MNSEPHKEGLIKLYKYQLTGEKDIVMIAVLQRALIKLSNNAPPKQVEDWVVKIERLWNKL